MVKARMFTENFGGINDFQVMHLKYWSRLALPHCHDVEIAVALPSLETAKGDNGSGTVDTLNDESRVEFRGLTNAKPPKNAEKVYAALYRSIGDLLGKHFDFAVIINGQKMFSRTGKKRNGANIKAIIDRLRQENANVA